MKIVVRNAPVDYIFLDAVSREKYYGYIYEGKKCFISECNIGEWVGMEAKHAFKLYSCVNKNTSFSYESLRDICSALLCNGSGCLVYEFDTVNKFMKWLAE